MFFSFFSPNRGSSYEKVGVRTSFESSSLILLISQLGRLDEAIRDFTEALRLDPKNAASYNSRALAYDRKTEYQKALLDFSKVTRTFSCRFLSRHFFI